MDVNTFSKNMFFLNLNLFCEKLPIFLVDEVDEVDEVDKVDKVDKVDE